MSEWSLAVRNLLRNRRRSLSTLVALALGLMTILLFSGFKANLTYTGLTAFARAGGHLQVQHRDYFSYGSANPTAFGIAGHDRLINAIRNDPVLAPLMVVATPKLTFGGLAGNFEAGLSRTVIGTGYVASDVNAMRRWNEFDIAVTRSRFALEGTPLDSAIVGIGVARVLQLCVAPNAAGCSTDRVTASAPRTAAAPAAALAATVQHTALPSDIAALADGEHTAALAAGRPVGAARLEVLASSARGAPNVAALNVVAAEDQGFKELDEVSLIVHLQQAQQLVFGRGAQKVTALMVLLARTQDQPVAEAALRSIVHNEAGGQPLVVRTFQELNPFFVQTEQMFDVIFQFIFVLIAGIVLFTVSNTMNAAVVERTTEIGTLRALGLKQSGIRRLFVIEGFVLGCLGALVGIVAAVVVGEVVNRSGVTWLPPGSSERLLLQLRVLGNVDSVLSTSLSLVVIAAVSAWWPAWRAARLNVVEALRHA